MSVTPLHRWEVQYFAPAVSRWVPLRSYGSLTQAMEAAEHSRIDNQDEVRLVFIQKGQHDIIFVPHGPPGAYRSLPSDQGPSPDDQGADAAPAEPVDSLDDACRCGADCRGDGRPDLRRVAPEAKFDRRVSNAILALGIAVSWAIVIGIVFAISYGLHFLFPSANDYAPHKAPTVVYAQKVLA